MEPTDEPDPGAVTAASDLAQAWLERVTAALPTGELRPQQAAMTRAVAGAVASGRHLVVQAGTGTGKSLGYTVPAVASGRKVVVATATKALQDQLAQKDLPSIAGALDRGFTFAVLKGRSNYLCRQRAAEIEDRGVQPQLSTDEPIGGPPPAAATLWAIGAAFPDAIEVGPSVPPSPTADPEPSDAGDAGDPVDAGDTGSYEFDPEDPGSMVDQVRLLLRWAEDTDTGDRGDLPFEPHQRAWSMVSVGPRECPGAYRCPSGNRCFAEKARAEAAAADVVVVNTHLYGAHLASGGVVLPPHDVVVFDEAHEVEEIMTASLGVEITPGRLRALQAMSRPLLKDEEGAGTLNDLGELADRLQGALEGRVGTRVLHVADREPAGSPPPDPAAPDPASPGPAPPGPASPGPASPDPASADLEPQGWERSLPSPPTSSSQSAADPLDVELTEVLERSSSRVDRLLALLRRGTNGAPSEDRGGEAAGDGGRRARAVSAAGHLVDDLGRLAGRAGDEVSWVDGTTRAPVLRLSPIDVGPPLAKLLWGEVTAVLTSATIPQRLTERLGLSGFAVDEMDVGSPFDYRSHALLYVARHLPDRRRPESELALQEELGSLIEAAGGRTLALFTSRRATEAAASALAPRLPYRILVQGQLPKGRLLETFAEEETSCLFATLGFWQGVDVPGRSLSLVTLDRLPFARPDDPLLQARRERAGDGAFRLVDLPRAATLLAQGAGRLIRSADDYGVVAVLDPRLATAGYRGVLLAGMPPMRRTTELAQVRDFLDRVLAGRP